MREVRKFHTTHRTIQFDPMNLYSKYGAEKVREMIARGEVVVHTSPWRDVIVED